MCPHKQLQLMVRYGAGAEELITSSRHCSYTYAKAIHNSLILSSSNTRELSCTITSEDFRNPMVTSYCLGSPGCGAWAGATHPYTPGKKDHHHQHISSYKQS
ncbi:hypothetical protein E2C01_021221 [Portunus trituberculatus]|uniref:Uncharacterized protein n=1 Tax=Portunus trituberculatus TaxID=210409 RepID=A0A5B7E2P2_PORTR|nr:hypothetical protein [Portunus trituberculatus]